MYMYMYLTLLYTLFRLHYFIPSNLKSQILPTPMYKMYKCTSHHIIDLNNRTTVLQSKRVDFEYGVFSAVFTGQTCMSRVIICYSVLSRIGLYISENMDCNYL